MGNTQSSSSSSISTPEVKVNSPGVDEKVHNANARIVDQQATKSMLSAMKAALGAIDMGKYGLAKNILGTVIDKAQVPMKSNREVVDERTTKDVIAAMGAACRALNAEKYALATNIIATQMEKMPHVVDEDITKSMLSALGTAHSAVYMGKYALIADIIVKFIDTARFSTNEFRRAAAEHQVRCKKNDQRIMCLSQTLTMYERVLELRPTNKMIQGLVKICAEDLRQAKEAARLKSGDHQDHGRGV